MVEGYADFPEFERLIEEGSSTVYHEVLQYEWDQIIGIFVAIFSLFPLGFSYLKLYPIMQDSIIQSIGLMVSLIGVIIFLRGFVLHHRLLRKYRYQGLSRNIISDAITYIDSQLAISEEFKKGASSQRNIPYSTTKFLTMREQFVIFIKSTAGLISWPSEIINNIELDLNYRRKGLRILFAFLVFFFFILAIASYYLLTSGELYLELLGLIPAFLLLQSAYHELRILQKSPHKFKIDWIAQVKKTDSIELEETLSEIFALLQTEYRYPLRFYLVKDYPQLKYTGRTKTSETLVQLKEAVFYPRDPM